MQKPHTVRAKVKASLACWIFFVMGEPGSGRPDQDRAVSWIEADYKRSDSHMTNVRTIPDKNRKTNCQEIKGKTCL